MGKILVVPLPELGHILPTISITQYLISRGHEVVYLTAPQFSMVVEGAGASWIALLAQDDSDKIFSARHIWNEFAPDTGGDSRSRRLSELIRRSLGEDDFSLMLVDHIIATDYGCPVSEIADGRHCLLFSTSLPGWREYAKISHVSDTLVFCPEQLEIPKFRRVSPMLHYVEPSLRPLDEERPSDFESLDSIVLISFGSQSIRYRRMPEQFRLMAELAGRLPMLQFVLTTGITTSSILGDSGVMPHNLFVYDKVPQRILLDKTKVFITHGGLGSIKEAIMAGVPMVVLPASHDQPFNAMRIRFHGLGEAVFPEQQTIEKIETAVLSALTGRYNTNTLTMQQYFRTAEAAKPSHALIEAHL
jgi:UDP:flavonoid glycosyltransferase YjiC (YdhE family)